MFMFGTLTQDIDGLIKLAIFGYSPRREEETT